MGTAMKDNLVAEMLYDRETCDRMSDAEAETLWRLHQERYKTFDGVSDAYADTLGLEKSQLSDEQRADIIDKVEALTENYDGADTDARYLKEMTPSPPLTARLMRYHDLGLEISKIRDGLISGAPPE